MLRARLPRSALLAAAAAVTISSPTEKLPIYPRPTPDIILQETPSELERQIGHARRIATATYLDAHSRVQGVVSRWIGIEHAVETRVKSIIAPDEPLVPSALYVGVATLTGSVIARNRMFLWRIILPPTLLAISLNHFLPKTTHNLTSYFGSLEDTYFPTLAQKHDVANAHTQMTWELAKEATKNGRESIGNGVVDLIGRVQDATGLKLKETLGFSKAVAKEAQAQVKEVAHAAEARVEEAKGVAEKKVEEAKATVEKKVEDVKRLV